MTIKGFQIKGQRKIIIAIASISQPWQTIIFSNYFEKKDKGAQLLQLFFIIFITLKIMMRLFDLKSVNFLIQNLKVSNQQAGSTNGKISAYPNPLLGPNQVNSSF